MPPREIMLDDGTVAESELVDPPPEVIGPARVLVVGFSSVMTAEGQDLDPNGYVIAYDRDGEELDRRRLAAG